ncbi:TetR/AcrR family transcriptional regulator [Swaminathania salitolerans]|uniref:Transcriptional regulator n=1 Tax=Swaminathania salitolerans TaxID=182838 RepID=A0A511BQW8_9PROT|nr:TetR/AcrR family transcriptional regulator [Swaminathania salitolerans]GBQ12116.1 TetR family transcriptional regulator [Swaminathania salitolerans LMG 21291]GEL02737.1 transcriptional regulator [Swaminathania salitolerans]
MTRDARAEDDHADRDHKSGAGDESGSGSAKRRQILDGAEAVFLERGYEGASMSQIACKARVSKGTLYNHFENKAALFGAVIEDLSRDKLAPALQKTEMSAARCAEAFGALAEQFIRVLLEPGPLRLYRIIVSEAPHFPDLADIFWRHGFGRTLSIMTEWIEHWIGRGAIATEDPVFAAEQFMALCQTRLVQRKRFELPVDTSDREIRFVAGRIGQAFVSIYGV